MKKNIYYYLWMIGIMVVLTACGQKPNLDASISGSLLSGELMAWSDSYITGIQQEIPSSWSFISWDIQSWTQISQKIKWIFSVELCNKIIHFSQCIISKAPIENQSVMKKKLREVLAPRKLLADAQLQEVCQQVTLQEKFQEVVEHYQDQGCVFQ